MDPMRTCASAIAIAVALTSAIAGQERKPVPKDSVRVAVPGCTKGYIFTAGPRTLEEPGNFEIREGMHLRMNGPKKLLNEIKAHEGSMIELTGLMKKGQRQPDGIGIGGGIRISPGPAPGVGGRPGGDPVANQAMIDVEGWRPVPGDCPSR